MHAQSAALLALSIAATIAFKHKASPHDAHQERHLQLQAVLSLRESVSGTLPCPVTCGTAMHKPEAAALAAPA